MGALLERVITIIVIVWVLIFAINHVPEITHALGQLFATAK